MWALPLFVLLPVVLGNYLCPLTWTMWGGYCYRQFIDKVNRVNYDQAQEKCRGSDSELALITSFAELEWLSSFSHIENTSAWQDLALIGFRKESYETSWEESYKHKYPAAFLKKICVTTFDAAAYHCTVIGDFTRFPKEQPCVSDDVCTRGHARFICKKPIELD